MTAVSVNPWRLPRCAAIALLLALGAAPGGAAAGSLKFDDVFNARGEPASLHYRVAFRSAGAVHGMEVWRDGERRVRRSTDRAITTFAFHRAGDAGYRLSILDRTRRIHTRIDRTNLYRIGQFADWFDLTHGLSHPKGDYRLARGSAPPAAPAALRPCAWYDLTEGTRATHICWDAADRLPLLIAASDGQLLWRVDALDRRQISPSRFAINDRGYVRNDADRDIERD